MILDVAYKSVKTVNSLTLYGGTRSWCYYTTAVWRRVRITGLTNYIDVSRWSDSMSIIIEDEAKNAG